MAHQLEKAVWACVLCVGAFHPNAPALVFGEATGLPSFSSMQQCGTTACCVVLSNEGVLTMDITVIERTLTPLADAV
jgi:hypothetical protein